MANDRADPNSMSFLQHTRELRKRIIRSAIAIVIAMFAFVYFLDPILQFLSKPLRDIGYELYTFKVQDGILAAMNSCFWAAFLATSPLWLTQILSFILPALDKKHRAAFWGFFLMSVIFLVSGFAFSYYVIIPMTIQFLLGFSAASFTNLVSAVSYIDFFLTFFFLTGLAFQLPLVMLLLKKTGIIDTAWIKKNRRIAIVGIVILAAIITPPDVVSQVALAIPMYLLFELGAILCRISDSKAERAASREADRG